MEWLLPIEEWKVLLEPALGKSGCSGMGHILQRGDGRCPESILFFLTVLHKNIHNGRAVRVGSCVGILAAQLLDLVVGHWVHISALSDPLAPALSLPTAACVPYAFLCSRPAQVCSLPWYIARMMVSPNHIDPKACTLIIYLFCYSIMSSLDC